ncbi:MAG: pyridoxamine 5'-phosphate oxidase family protein, partial [Gammaproteobacteria bacterium]
QVGLLGLDFATRRRNRANGVVSTAAAGVTTVRVQQSFGNCPQHIQRRQVHRLAPPGQHVSAAPHVASTLDARARRLVAEADTFFVATTGGGFGIDISHRGGPAGFVTIDGDTLTVPDFNGNRFFNTLGNLLLDARAALLFIDFDQGHLLELRGRAEVLWQIKPGTVGQADGRRWRFHPDSAVWTEAALPLRWEPLAQEGALR